MCYNKKRLNRILEKSGSDLLVALLDYENELMSVESERTFRKGSK
jgi:hypothetical protein